MTLALRPTLLYDLLFILQGASNEEKMQYKAFMGIDFDYERAAHESFGFIGPKWTSCTPDGVPVAVGGFILQRRGVYRTWFAYAPGAFEAHGREITRICAKVVAEMLESGGAHRLETLVLDSRRLARRWYGTIGLKFESLLPSYGANGETAALHVALRSPERVH